MWLLPSEQTCTLHRRLQDYLKCFETRQIMHDREEMLQEKCLQPHIFPSVLVMKWTTKQTAFNRGGGGITQLSLEFITSHPSLYCKKCSRLLQLLASKMTQGKYLKTTAYFHPPHPSWNATQSNYKRAPQKNSTCLWNLSPPIKAGHFI